MAELNPGLIALGKLVLAALKPKVCCVQCRGIVWMTDEAALERHSCDDPTLLDVLRAARMRNGETLQ